ncbi:MAG TPA: hypothetical protein ENJ89_07940 [Caldithrix abyssi]|uniref:Alginate export domain-containing protein n=1 Tax=Caldithrix abyssi TaxID=187145 RepID=A0A7V5PQ03_CALAY|nr:hypothetical protein [Caldithrix abyssi]
MKKWIYSLVLIFWSTSLFGQLSFKNQMVYTRWQEYDRTILENWTDLTYRHHWLKAGLRYEINHPPDPFIFPQDSLLDNYELTFRYLEFRFRKMEITLGNFYEMFGRGLTLRTYEDRNLRVDTNLDGVKFNWNRRMFRFKALAGKMRDKYNRRKDWLYGADGEIRAIKNVRFGASVLFQKTPGQSVERLIAGRFNMVKDRWDFYAEIARPSWYPAFSYYAAFNLFFDKVSATFEVKDYNHLSFMNSYSTEYNAAPSLTREHEFSLLNRHPHALDQNDERGYQVELSYTPRDNMELIANHSQTFTHQKNRIFEEYYLEWKHDVTEGLEYRLAGAWTFDFTTNTDNITPLIDGTFDLSEYDQLHLSLQHQHTKNRSDLSEYDNELVLLEYSRAPYFSAGVVGEYTNKYQLRNVAMDRHTWLYGIVTFSFWRNQRLSLLYGSRREGFVCVGGICRYEPEFRGFELKLTNRF